MNTTDLCRADVTPTPKLRPAVSEYGVGCGMWITLHDSVALQGREVIRIPAGTLITSGLSFGMGDLDVPVTRHKLGASGPEICYRAR